MKNCVKRIALILASVLLMGAVFSSLAACNNGDGNTAETTASIVDEVTSGEVDTVESGKETIETESEKSQVSESAEDSETDESGETDEATETTDSGAGGVETTESETQSEKQTEVETEDLRFEKEYAPVLYFSPEDIAKIAKDYEWGANRSNMLGGYLSDDKSYVTLIPFDGENESCFYLFQSIKRVGPIMVVKYRTEISGYYMEFFANSVDDTAQSGSNFNIYGLKTTGEWDVRMVDLREKLPTTFNGTGLAHMRFDFANGNPIPPETELDIEYIAFFNTIEDAQKFEYGEDYVAPEEAGSQNGNSPLYFAAVDIASSTMVNEAKNLDSAMLSDDLSYITLKPVSGSSPDAYVNVLKGKKNAAPYLAIKYRTEDLGYWIELFMDSVNPAAKAGSNFTFYPIDDGEWHIFVINLVDKLGEEKFNGETVNYIRFDFMNINSDQKFTDWSIDIEYIAFYETELEALGADYDPMAPVNMFDAEDIKTATEEKGTRVESAVLSEDKEYVTVTMAAGNVDSYAYLFTSKREAGRYMVVKYRTSDNGYYMILWTHSNAYTAGGAKAYVEGIKNDGEWKYAIIDLEAKIGDKFNGVYLAHLRFDFIHMSGDRAAAKDISVDVGYVAFFDSAEAAEAYIAQ